MSRHSSDFSDVLFFSNIMSLRDSSVALEFFKRAIFPDNMEIPNDFSDVVFFLEYHVFLGLLGIPELFACPVFPDNMESIERPVCMRT